MAHLDASVSPLSPSIAPVASSQQDKFVHGKKEEQRKEKQVQSTQSTVSSQTIKKVKKSTVQLDVTKILHSYWQTEPEMVFQQVSSTSLS